MRHRDGIEHAILSRLMPVHPTAMLRDHIDQDQGSHWPALDMVASEISCEATVGIRKSGDTVAMIILYSVLAAAGDAWAATLTGEALSQSWCSQCHAIKPDQFSANPAAPRFSDVAAEPSITEYSLRVFLKTPHPTMPNIMMKADDLDDIVSYILSLKPQR